jgi:GT2 family glycosyltransferase
METNKKSTIKKVVIAIPTEGHTLPEAYDNHLLVAKHIGSLEERFKHENRNPQYEFYWYTAGRLLTAVARENLTKQAIKGGMDFMIMFDDDMVLPIDFIESLLFDMEQHPEIGILGALAFMRNPPHDPVMFNTFEGYDEARHQPYYFNETVKNYPRNKLVECDAVGFGGVCIRMSIFDKMVEPYFFSLTGTGEDIHFCYKAKREAGTRVFMDTRIKLGHLMNPKIADEEYFDKYVKENKIEIKEVRNKYLSYDK